MSENNSSRNIAGFQFNIDGTTASAATDGDAAGAGFTVQAAGSTVLGFSFTGSTVAAGCGTLTVVSLVGEASGLSDLVFSDSAGAPMDIEYYNPNGGTLNTATIDISLFRYQLAFCKSSLAFPL